MAADIKLSTIADSISGLVVTGVTMLDLDQIPEAVDPRRPTFYPWPDGWVSGLEVERNSTGSLGTAKMTVHYVLHYRFCYAPIGSGRGLNDVYPDMVAKAVLLLNKVLDNDIFSGLVDFELAEALAFGVVEDPAGNKFYGCDLALRVMEFVN